MHWGSDAIFVYRYDLFPRLTLNEIIDLLDELDGETNIGVNPPTEDPEDDTDEDSDDSDDEVRGKLDHLPRRVISTDVISIDNVENDERDKEAKGVEADVPTTSKEPPKKIQKHRFDWHQNKNW